MNDVSLLGLSSSSDRFGPDTPDDAAAASRDVTTHRAESEPVVACLLVYNPPDHPAGGYGLGWTLIAQHHTGWSWRMSLAARGAGAHAGPRVAKAVAVRVLAGQGVPVDGWDDHQPRDHDQADGPAGDRDESGRHLGERDHGGDIAVSRARLARPAPAQPPGAPNEGLRATSLGHLRGH